MNLLDIVNRAARPQAGAGSKIPWNEPEFSRRMLASHLDQNHDWASRRSAVLDAQADYIGSLLSPSSRILDLGCGPGLYLSRLAGRGHRCVGVDFSPAAVEYARERAETQGLDIAYTLADLREYAPPVGAFDAVLFLFGEINVFSRAEAAGLLRRACAALKPGGLLFLEAHVFAEVKRQGLAPPAWQSLSGGVFLPRPHLCLSESFWDEAAATALTRYFVVDAETAACAEYASGMCAYTDEAYLELLREAGFADTERPDGEDWPVGPDFTDKLQLFVCRKS